MFSVRLRSGLEFQGQPGQTILAAALSQSVAIEYSCRTGLCGVCKAQILGGDTRVVQPEISLSAEDAAAGYGLTCCRSAETLVLLNIEDLRRLAHLKVRTSPARISAVEHISDQIVRVLLRLPPTITFDYVAGQYIDVIWGKVRRSYSLASAPRSDNLLELHIRAFDNGAMTSYWFGRAQPNDLVRIEGPLGTFFLRDEPVDHFIFLATGTGIAPVKAILEAEAERLSAEGARVSILWGNRRIDDFYWQPLVQGAGVSYIPVLSGADPIWAGERGHIQTVALKADIDLGRAAIYACGSQAMIEESKALFVARGLNDHRFYYDAFVESGKITQ